MEIQILSPLLNAKLLHPNLELLLAVLREMQLATALLLPQFLGTTLYAAKLNFRTLRPEFRPLLGKLLLIKMVVGFAEVITTLETVITEIVGEDMDLIDADFDS